MNKDRIAQAIEVIHYALDHQIGMKEASVRCGHSDTYVKNVKAAVYDKYGRDKLDEATFNNFIEQYAKYEKQSEKPKTNIKAESKISKIESINTIENDIESETTSSFEDYCKANKIDQNEVITYWHKSKQYSIYLRNNQEKLNQQFEILKDILKSEIIPIKKTKTILPSKNSDNCAVINIFDLHIDKKAYDSIEDGINSVIKVKDEIKTAFDEILQSTLIHNPKTIIFPIGNDLLNSNGFTNETVRGTPQKNLVEQDAAFRQALELCKYMIDRLVQESNAEILIPIVSGNHSKHSEFYLGVCLEVMYHNNEQVIINNEIKDDRKYYIFEDILFAFMHGDKYLNKIAQLPMIVMQENRENLSKTKFTQCYLGDQHHKQEFKFFRTKDFPGCNVTFLRGTSVTDGWHQDMGYIGVPRTLESFIWKKNKGQIANYSINL